MDVAFSPDDRTLAAGYYGAIWGGVVLWEIPGQKRLADVPLPVEEGHVGGVGFSPDGKTLAAGFGDGKVGGVVLWDIPGQKRLADVPLIVSEGDVTNVAFSPDGKTLAAGFVRVGDGNRGGGVVLWDVATPGA